jgi:hypothetical protein
MTNFATEETSACTCVRDFIDHHGSGGASTAAHAHEMGSLFTVTKYRESSTVIETAAAPERTERAGWAPRRLSAGDAGANAAAPEPRQIQDHYWPTLLCVVMHKEM